ncbi:hypothetical protein ABID08_000733 [Rhizobium binae]|uniref:DUF2730 family protein n=1 Tax=Rhizobium binae TaxID=1138190 RepID=A0ABV2MB80_9HYPH|nr:hypothetical protein [Rhizobium binae]MBX4992302.1 hypothetical protein [Rhizobium binae]NKL52781.1 hypothetical protein [Rhizobium leguminosarum bv. viciae]QSY80732.1 hypothetical protein J2J99_13500 [Rhizobium binae]
MTGPEIMAVVGFGLAVFGTIFAIWKYLDSKLMIQRRDTEKVAEELAQHRLHVAESYVSKAGLRETTDQIMEAISGVKAAVDNMTLRVDRIVENQPRRTTTRG